MAGDSGVGKLKGYIIAFGSFAIIDLMVAAVLTGFKNTNTVDNDTADLLIAALLVFATFAGIVALALMGKIVIGLFTNKGY